MTAAPCRARATAPRGEITADEAAALVPDGAVVTVSSSSGLGCPDRVLLAIGERFGAVGRPRGLTMLHPIAAGDMYGIKGIDHLARPGLLARVVAGSYPSGPSSLPTPDIWRLIEDDEVPAYNVPSGILFDMTREAAARRPGVLTRVGLGTFVDPQLQGCAMNAAAAARPIVRRVSFDGDTWLYFPAIVPDVAIIRGTSADDRGNISWEQEGACLGALDQALAARNNGGIVIAQVKRRVGAGTLGPMAVHVPGVLVDHVVVEPDQWQTTQTVFDPAICGQTARPLGDFPVLDFGPEKVIARRAALELGDGMAVTVGFGISANVPRILLEEGQHGAVTWILEQGAVGGVPLLGFAFGCAANAEAIIPSPHQFTYLQGGGFDASLLSFLQIDREGNVNVSRLAARPHVTAGAGGFVDTTANAPRIVFAGHFTAGARLGIAGGALRVESEGKARKLVEEVEHVTFSGRRARASGQDVLYVTERCVLRLGDGGPEVVEVAPGIDLERDVLARSDFPLRVARDATQMEARLFRPEPMGLALKERRS